MRTYAAQKAGLTRAQNSKVYARVLTEVQRVIVEWEALPYGWPDDWHRWNIALEDAWNQARYEYRHDRLDELPEHVTMDELRMRHILGRTR